MWRTSVQLSLLKCARLVFQPRPLVIYGLRPQESQLRSIHVACNRYSEKKFRKEREKAVIVNKIKKKARGVVVIRSRMRISELAEALSRPVDDIFEALILVKNFDTSHYDDERKKIEELDVIKQVVELCGHRYRVLGNSTDKAAPKVSAVDEEEQDLDEYSTMNEPEKGAGPSVLNRPPVVTMMGHVDHGKTSLLDAFRNSNLCAAEFGGITQHIGAFSVRMADFLAAEATSQSRSPSSNGWNSITFLDTPGHAAFTAMRARGARVTDIVVLVVAADDGVQPQTLEALAHARAANVPLVIALNKVDKPDSNIERTKLQLAKAGILLEQFGGDVQCVEVSALRRTGLTRLAEAILAQAALVNLRADTACRAEGYILEARCDARSGRVATALIRKGTLRRDSVLVCGGAWCRVRRLTDERGTDLRDARPGDAVQLSAGWHLDALPAVGDVFLEVPSIERAQQVVSFRARRNKEQRAMADAAVVDRQRAEQARKYREARMRTLAAVAAASESKHTSTTAEVSEAQPEAEESTVAAPAHNLHVILKADVHGSLEALQHVLATYAHTPASSIVQLSIVGSSIGEVTETDVTLARQFNATIFCFQTGLSESSRRLNELAKAQSVRIRRFEIVYDLVEAVRLELESKLPPQSVEVVHGEANVLQVFLVSIDDQTPAGPSASTGKRRRKAAVIGGKCSKGIIQRKKLFRVIRDDRVLLEGLQCVSLRHFKEEAAQIGIQQECGIRLDAPEGFEFLPGDVVQCYEIVQEQGKLAWSHGC